MTKLPRTILDVLHNSRNYPTSDREIERQLYAALEAVLHVDPEDPAAIDAVAERLGDAAEMAGLPRGHFFDHGTIPPNAGGFA
jgi:hypothetical protein